MKNRRALVVVVVGPEEWLDDGFIASDRPDRDWSCFVGDDHDHVMDMAIEAKEKWERRTDRKYRLYSGSVTHTVVLKNLYTVKKGV
jgi:hypothetical protein